MPKIDSVKSLYARYKKPGKHAVAKEINYLDKHCRKFLSLSPFLIVATIDLSGNLDTSPRGGQPGFANVLNDKTIIIPDWPGNNRLDTFKNIIATGSISLIFLIPGITETLRINGKATLLDDDHLLALCMESGKVPKLIISVTVEQIFLHCAKAVIRSHLWDPKRHVPRTQLPTMANMLKAHTGMNLENETHEKMLDRYKQELY